MHAVSAPDGFEAQRTYDDATRSWRVFARPVGGRWWQCCGLVGTAGVPDKALDEMAANTAENWIELGMVR